MKRVLLIAALAVLGAAPAFGDAALLAKYRGPADTCWQAAGGDLETAKACNGLVFDACSTGEPGGQSNSGMSQCLYAEAAFWDEKLNQAWGRAMALVQQADADERDYAPELAVREEKLREAERAWIAFRDAQCAFDYALAGGGSIRLLYYPSCLADMSFNRVLELMSISAEFGG